MNAVLVRPPSPRLADGELTHRRREAVDPDLALTQWRGYVGAWRDAGWAVQEVPALDEHPDGVFIEDPLLVLGDVAVLTSPGVASRRGELPSAAVAAEDAGLDVARVEYPATLEGGDVLRVGRTLYVGRSSRTNELGLQELAAIAEPLGYTVVPVQVSRTLHLKSGVTALPDGTVLGYPPLVDDLHAFSAFLAVPEPEGCAVVVLDDETVLLSASAPRTAALLQERGLRTVAVEIGEFEKLEGCVTCLSVRVRTT